MPASSHLERSGLTPHQINAPPQNTKHGRYFDGNRGRNGSLQFTLLRRTQSLLTKCVETDRSQTSRSTHWFDLIAFGCDLPANLKRSVFVPSRLRPIKLPAPSASSWVARVNGQARISNGVGRLLPPGHESCRNCNSRCPRRRQVSTDPPFETGPQPGKLLRLPNNP